MMKRRMRAPWQQFEIRQNVVPLFVILVVDYFISAQPTTKMLLHHLPML